MHQVTMHYMDVLAAMRVAAAQARRDGMPLCAARHEADATALEAAYYLADGKCSTVGITFYPLNSTEG